MHSIPAFYDPVVDCGRWQRCVSRRQWRGPRTCAVYRHSGVPAPTAPPDDRSAPLPTPEIRPKSAYQKKVSLRPSDRRRRRCRNAKLYRPRKPPSSGSSEDSRAKAPVEPKGLAVAPPRPKEREKALPISMRILATADDEAKAKSDARSIERLWLTSGSDTVNLLMHRAMEASHAKNNGLASIARRCG